MKISNNIYYCQTQTFAPKTSFGAAKDITLEYVLNNRKRLLPERIRRETRILVSRKNKIEKLPTLKELHLSTYSRLLECRSLSEAKNLYPEFREILEADAVIKKGSKNTKKIEEKVPLKDLSLYILKERWGKMKTLNEAAQELGLKDRSALGWVLDKIRMPDLGKNYQALLKASDSKSNELISSKVKAYNALHRDKVIAHNRAVSQNPNSRKKNSEISKEAWRRLPHIREKLKEFSKTSNSKDRFNDFWQKYPEYAKEYGAMKKTVKEEMKNRGNY